MARSRSRFIRRSGPEEPVTEREYVAYVRGRDFTVEIATIPTSSTASISYAPETEPLNRATAIRSLEHLIRLAVGGVHDHGRRTYFDPMPIDARSSVARDLDAISFAELPVIVLEQSSAKALSLNDVIDKFGDAPGAMLAMVVTGTSPWLVLTIPLGIIGFRVSREIGTALGEVAGDWIRELKPKGKIGDN